MPLLWSDKTGDNIQPTPIDRDTASIDRRRESYLDNMPMDDREIEEALIQYYKLLDNLEDY